jgi:hypothetical protein
MSRPWAGYAASVISTRAAEQGQRASPSRPANLIRAYRALHDRGLIFWGLGARQILADFPPPPWRARSIALKSRRIGLMAFYVVAVGMSTFARPMLAPLRTRLIFIVGGLAQLLIVASPGLVTAGRGGAQRSACQARWLASSTCSVDTAAGAHLALAGAVPLRADKFRRPQADRSASGSLLKSIAGAAWRGAAATGKAGASLVALR